MLRGSIASAVHFDTSTARENGNTWSRLPVISNRMTASVTDSRVTPHMTAPAQTYRVISTRCFITDGVELPMHKPLEQHKLMERLQPDTTQIVPSPGTCCKNIKVLFGRSGTGMTY